MKEDLNTMKYHIYLANLEARKGPLIYTYPDKTTPIQVSTMARPSQRTQPPPL